MSAMQAKSKTATQFVEGADGAGHEPPAPAPFSPQVPVADAPLVSAAQAGGVEPPAAPALMPAQAASTEAPQYAAKPPKTFDKDCNFMLKMKPDLANKVERAFSLRDPNVFASRQEMLREMLSVALDAYIKSRS